MIQRVEKKELLLSNPIQRTGSVLHIVTLSENSAQISG